ncbi:MAG: hypothetical protein P8X63_04045, partial [Desulfuromonadaceae bacterium]
MDENLLRTPALSHATTVSTQLRHLRLEPLNQLASLKLKAAGLVEDPAVLPVFVLMEWGLLHGQPFSSRRLGLELLQLRFLPDQRLAIDYLLENLPGGLPALHRKLLRLPPMAAAQTLLEVLD